MVQRLINRVRKGLGDFAWSVALIVLFAFSAVFHDMDMED